MRATLLTAQRMADSMVHEAEARRDDLISQAEKDIQSRKLQLEREAEAMEARLRLGQEELAKFIRATRDLFSKEMQFFENLPQMETEASAPPAQEPEPEPVAEIEERVMASFQTPLKAEEPAEAAAPVQEPEADPFTGEILEPTRRINLDDLKFGRNYTSGV